ncbi:endonuclease/exonuclease/phosphatase family protein [Streptomyces beijiangensis]|uniref:Endonuclease/exonuclease/phosphatase family protein n=1 Tax=Streptomyces beijiangensis TaxID=163361 RepID=A0A939FBZ3_9ACTN|nr:endonuclease/exonuclease/phosphatase family protein [Streptomyces beijiangensis]
MGRPGTAHEAQYAGRPPSRRSRWRSAAAWIAGLILLGVSAVVGCRAADTDAITPVPQILAFLPWLLAPAAFALLLAGLARWWTGLVWAVLVLAALGWFLRPYGPGPGSVQPRGPLLQNVKVLTANLQFGRATGALLATVRSEKPDIVFVEECAFVCADALAADLPRSQYPYRNVVRKDGSEGSAILSAFPLKDANTIDSSMAMPGAVAEIHGVSVRLQLAHPMPPLPSQVPLWQHEVGKVRAFAAAAPDQPTIVAGDFNASQDHAAFRAVLDDGKLNDSARLAGKSRSWSWPAEAGRFLHTQIDHVLVSKDFEVNSARFVPLTGSDHRGLVVELELHGR